MPVRQTRMVYTVNRLSPTCWQPWLANREWVRSDLDFSRGWDESTDRRKGYFESALGGSQFMG